MSNTRRLLAAALACVLSSAAATADDADAASQARQEILLDTIRANRKAFLAVNLELSAEETRQFWPLYDRYHAELDPVGDRIAAIVEDYTASFRDLPNEKALKLIEGYLAAEADRLAVRRRYLAEFAKILPGRTVARFYQIENKMDAVLRHELAATIPVVEEEGSAPAK